MRITKAMQAQLKAYLMTNQGMTEAQAEAEVMKQLENRKAMQAKKEAEAVNQEGAYIAKLEKKHNESLAGLSKAELIQKLAKLEATNIEKICRNVAREVAGIVSYEDIMQEVLVKLWESPEVVTNVCFFFAKVKQIALDSVKQEVRRYRKYAMVPMTGKPKFLNDLKLSVRFPKFSYMKHDIRAMLTNEEYEVFQLFYMQGFSMLEVDQKIGKRCDRTLKRVKEKVGSYLVEV